MFILPNTYFYFNTFKMVNLIIVNCHSTTLKNHFRFFFYLIKYYFNFKFNHFKYLRPNTHSYSNTFKIVNSFYLFQMRMSKISTMTVNKRAQYRLLILIFRFFFSLFLSQMGLLPIFFFFFF